jgi:HlyD family secretion protein
MSHKPNKIQVIAGLLVLSGVAGLVAWWILHEQGDDAHEVVLYGNVDIRQVALAFDGNEHIATMLAHEGERVKAGQLLASLHKQRLREIVARAAAEVEAQRQVVARLQAGSRPEEIRKARADVEAAAIVAQNAQRTYERQRGLLRQKLIAQETVDDTKAAAEAAQARLKAARETLDLLLAGSRKEDIAAAEATLKADEAQLAFARQQLADADLYAPADGIIQNRILEPGDMVSPQTPVYTLALTDPVWVRAYVAESDLGKIHLGMDALVSTDSYPGKRYRAWIGFISPTAEFTPKSVETTDVRTSLVYQVRVYACNPQNELRLGMPATVTIPLDQKRESGMGEQEPCKEP